MTTQTTFKKRARHVWTACGEDAISRAMVATKHSLPDAPQCETDRNRVGIRDESESSVATRYRRTGGEALTLTIFRCPIQVCARATSWGRSAIGLAAENRPASRVRIRARAPAVSICSCAVTARIDPTTHTINVSERVDFIDFILTGPPCWLRACESVALPCEIDVSILRRDLTDGRAGLCRF
jgi:hypothetical protein